MGDDDPAEAAARDQLTPPGDQPASQPASQPGSAPAGDPTKEEAQLEPPPLPPPELTARTIPGLIRRVRRLADLSQRELARNAKVSRSTVARIESGALTPSLDMLLRLLAVARLVLVVTAGDGQVVQPMRIWDDTRDGAERAFPAHLDLILDPRGNEWWADVYGMARPPETFHRDRAWRDAMRRRSQWEVRVKQFRHAPPPPDPDRDPLWWRRGRY